MLFVCSAVSDSFPAPIALTYTDDEDGRLPQSRRGSELALKTRSAGPAAPSDSSGGVLRALPVSLADLIHAGLLTPGEGVLSVAYKGSTHRASLLADGTIRHDGKVYNSASAFSIHVKRLITPDKQGDDGWKSVLYAGKPLDSYRCVVFCCSLGKGTIFWVTWHMPGNGVIGIHRQADIRES